MALVRVQVATHLPTELAVDWIVNTVYFEDDNLPLGDTDYNNLAVGTRDVFRARVQHPKGYVVQATAYDMSDAKPRPIRGFAAPAPVSAASASDAGVREVALCLSYYSERNLPRQRGRLYLGPWTDAQMQLRPNSFVIDAAKAIATGLQAVGGVDVDWSVFSTKDNAARKITAGWVDNEWDTVRSRGLRATTRSTYTTSE